MTIEGIVDAIDHIRTQRKLMNCMDAARVSHTYLSCELSKKPDYQWESRPLLRFQLAMLFVFVVVVFLSVNFVDYLVLKKKRNPT